MEFVTVREDEKDILNKLFEYYDYEFSKYYKFDLNENGECEKTDVNKYFKNNDTQVFFIKEDNTNVGFIIVEEKKSINHIIEFFIIPEYRKGLFTYKFLKMFIKRLKGRFFFSIINSNERWLKAIKYMIEKNSDLVKIIGIVPATYSTETKKYEFTDFLIKVVE